MNIFFGDEEGSSSQASKSIIIKANSIDFTRRVINHPNKFPTFMNIHSRSK